MNNNKGMTYSNNPNKFDDISDFFHEIDIFNWNELSDEDKSIVFTQEFQKLQDSGELHPQKTHQKSKK